MLKPKYKTVSDLVEDFNSNIRYLDKYIQMDQSLLEKETKVRPLAESAPVKADPKPEIKAEAVKLSKYSSPEKALDSFKVLAGMVESEREPWNPGICAETRTVGQILEDADIVEDGERRRAEGGVGGLGSDQPHYKKDLGGYSPKAAHHAVRTSERTLANAHAAHSYMNELPGHAQHAMKQQLGAHSEHAAYRLRGAADGAPEHIYHHLHSLADRHERHARIYRKGGRPKLEAIQEMQAVIESIDPLDFYDTFTR